MPPCPKAPTLPYPFILVTRRAQCNVAPPHCSNFNDIHFHHSFANHYSVSVWRNIWLANIPMQYAMPTAAMAMTAAVAQLPQNPQQICVSDEWCQCHGHRSLYAIMYCICICRWSLFAMLVSQSSLALIDVYTAHMQANCYAQQQCSGTRLHIFRTCANIKNKQTNKNTTSEFRIANHDRGEIVNVDFRY